MKHYNKYRNAILQIKIHFATTAAACDFDAMKPLVEHSGFVSFDSRTRLRFTCYNLHLDESVGRSMVFVPTGVAGAVGVVVGNAGVG